MSEPIRFSHRSVLLDECIEALDIKEDGIYVDGTAGGGGHSYEIAKRLKNGLLIAIDQDAAAIEAASAKLSPFGDRVKVVRDNFSNLASVCKSLGIEKIDGLLLDLGVSSPQLDDGSRGFSYMADAPLDMRMNAEDSLTADQVVNTWSQEELKRILYDYGEERYAPQIASAICRRRENAPISTTLELVDVIRGAMPPAALREKQHPAKRSFQAIRIAVNDELGSVERAMKAAIPLLNPGGRLVIITFHSLEDRIVKNAMVEASKGCTCPPNFPVCVCGKKPKVKLITKKPITASAEELEVNPRSRSAKLRICEKL
jgi:16S rRNA (cytosine1402-N4)-methyltransferase